MKKITVSSELAYLIANLILSLAVAMISAANFGVSMIVAPAYMVHLTSQNWPVALSFGQAEYVIQGLLFVLFCLLMRRFRWTYLFSFGTGLLYGGVLDLWRLIIPHFNPAAVPPGSLPLWLNILYFVIGEAITAIAIALFFRTYLYAQIYDFFVKGIAERYHLPQTKFKIGFDVTFLVIGGVLSLTLFGELFGHGIGVGTLIMTAVNGALIGLAGKALDRFFVFTPTFPKLARYFDT